MFLAVNPYSHCGVEVAKLVFFPPFGYLLEYTGLWTSCWMFMLILSAVCLTWLHLTAQKVMKDKHPEDMQKIEEK